MTATVVVAGGGYGGIVVARALDDLADVVLVEPRDAFVHNVAALRALVDPGWADRIYLPYDRLLARGRVVRDRAVRVDAGSVTLGSGQTIDADYIVLATGSAYPFPAKTEDDDSAGARARIRRAHDELARAGRVLLLGAGPVGLELAGEITAAWPGKSVTIIDPLSDILSGGYAPAGYDSGFRAELRRQLGQHGVSLLLETSLPSLPPTAPGLAEPFTVTTLDGRQLEADIWFRCFGVTPRTGYLSEAIATARLPDGHLAVTPELRLPGYDQVFAIGDLTATPEAKTAKAAGLHAGVVAANIASLIDGGSDLRAYRPGPPGLVVPLGPHGGASYTADRGVLDAQTTSQIKGTHMMADRFAQLLNLTPAPDPAVA
jgi:apoptosis-inducing factor 2